MAFCDVCGTLLKEEEEEREIKGKQVCHDCLHDGLKLLQGKVGQLKREGADRRESKRALAEEKAQREKAQQKKERQQHADKADTNESAE